MGGGAFFLSRKICVPCLNLLERIGLQPVNKVIRLDSQAFAPTHFDKGSSAVLGRQFNTQLSTRRWRQSHHFVTEMNTRVLADLRHYSGNPSSYDVLRIRLTGVDDVVDGHATTKFRMVHLFRVRIGSRDP